MTTEEKAKAYDEAVERIAMLLGKDGTVIGRYWLEEIFPQLTESEDERIRTRLIALVEAFGQGKYKDEMLAYLEKQKEQKPAEITPNQFDGITYGMKGYSSERPAEWSEEDEKTVQWAYDVLRRIGEGVDSQITKANTQELSIKLKSLRPQPHWKPSEEQMAVLKNAIHFYGGTIGKDILESLYNDLKKLI